MTGGVVSETVTVKDLGVAALPLASCALQVTVVMPIANVEPDAGLQVTVGFGSTASVAVAVNETGAPVELVAETAMLPGTVMVGGIVS
jgi:O-glycosyl hydrolase